MHSDHLTLEATPVTRTARAAAAVLAAVVTLAGCAGTTAGDGIGPASHGPDPAAAGAAATAAPGTASASAAPTRRQPVTSVDAMLQAVAGAGLGCDQPLGYDHDAAWEPSVHNLQADGTHLRPDESWNLSCNSPDGSSWWTWGPLQWRAEHGPAAWCRHMTAAQYPGDAPMVAVEDLGVYAFAATRLEYTPGWPAEQTADRIGGQLTTIAQYCADR